MRSQVIFGGVACLSAVAFASPIGSPGDGGGNPHEKRNISVPGYLIPTTTPNTATWTGEQTISPDRLPTSTVDLEKRNILVPGYLIPTTTPDPATWSGSQTVSPDRLPTSTVGLAKRDAPVTVDGIVYPTGFPDLVPTSKVDIATDTAGTRTISPQLIPTAVATIGTTSGCIVILKSHSYVTHCSHTKAPKPTSTGIADCCGGEDSLYPCNSDGSMPTGTALWTCTLGSTSCAGTYTATTTWV